MRLDASIAARFAAIPVDARRIIARHDAFGYYGARYGIEFLAAQGLNTDAEPSARAIAGLGGTVYSDSLSVTDGPAGNYLHMLRYNTGLFVAAMGA